MPSHAVPILRRVNRNDTRLEPLWADREAPASRPAACYQRRPLADTQSHRDTMDSSSPKLMVSLLSDVLKFGLGFGKKPCHSARLAHACTQM